MTEIKDYKTELKESYDQNTLMERNIDTGLSFLMKLCPIDTITQKIENMKPEYVGDSKGKLQGMTQDWIGMYADFIEAGKTLPVDLIGRAAEIAHAARKQPETKPV